MVQLADLFSGSVALWISDVTSKVTGAELLTLLFALLVVLLLLSVFRFPEFFYVVLLFPLVMLMGATNAWFNIFIGVAILYAAITLWSLFPKN